MELKKCLTIGLVLGVFANVTDFIVHVNLLAGHYSQAPFRHDSNLVHMIVATFVAAFVFT